MPKIYNKTLGYFTLPAKSSSSKDLEYLASGGQADIFITKDKKYAFKVFHDSNSIISEDKIKELSSLKNPNIITPIDLLYENQYVGYYMSYIRAKTTLLELFPKAFKTANNLDINQRKFLVEKLMDLVSEVHSFKFLIVDLNAKNVIVDKSFKDIYLIDTDSYQTQNFKATGIQESIRDPLVKKNQFTQESDWFSFACLAFELYTNIHPYEGMHPSFLKEKNGESVIEQRLKAKISIFDKEVRYPKMAVEDFSVIPKKHLNWFQDLFINNNRSKPQKSDASSPQSNVSQFVIVKSSDKLITDLLVKTDSIINNCFFIKGNFVLKTKDGFYINSKKVWDDPEAIPALNSDGRIIFLDQKPKYLLYNAVNIEYDYVESISGNLFRMNNSSLFFDQIHEKAKTFLESKVLGRFGESAKLGQGLIFDRCLGSNRLLIFNEGKTKEIFLHKDLNPYQILDAQCSKDFALLVASKSREFYKILVDLNTKEYIKSKSNFFSTNIIGLSNGINIKLEKSTLSIFKNLQTIKRIDNCGLDDGCRFITNGISLFFYNDNGFYKCSMK